MHFLSPVDTSLGRSASFIFCLSVWRLSGLVASWICPHFYPAVSSKVGIWELLFLVYKVHDSTPWNFRKFLEDSTPFLRVLLDWFVSDIFGRGSKVISEIDENYRTNWTIFSVQYSWRSLILLPVCCVHMTAISWKRYCGLILIPWLNFENGLWRSWRDCFVTESYVPGILLPAFCSRHPLTSKVTRVYFTFSMTGFISVDVFPLIL